MSLLCDCDAKGKGHYVVLLTLHLDDVVVRYPEGGAAAVIGA